MNWSTLLWEAGIIGSACCRDCAWPAGDELYDWRNQSAMRAAVFLERLSRVFGIVLFGLVALRAPAQPANPLNVGTDWEAPGLTNTIHFQRWLGKFRMRAS